MKCGRFKRHLLCTRLMLKLVLIIDQWCQIALELISIDTGEHRFNKTANTV